jgi:hypothetical protein
MSTAFVFIELVLIIVPEFRLGSGFLVHVSVVVVGISISLRISPIFSKVNFRCTLEDEKNSN